jgi:hypothetical protein
MKKYTPDDVVNMWNGECIEYVSVVNTNYKVKNWLVYFLTLGRKGGYLPDKVPTLEEFIKLKYCKCKIRKFAIYKDNRWFCKKCNQLLYQELIK